MALCPSVSALCIILTKQKKKNIPAGGVWKYSSCCRVFPTNLPSELKYDFFIASVDLLLLVGRGGDRAVRIHHRLGAAYHRHQEKETQQEEEEERKPEVHIHLEGWRLVRRLVHVADADSSQMSSLTSSPGLCSAEMKKT